MKSFAPLEDKMEEDRLRQFGHLQHRSISLPTRKSDKIMVNGAM